MNEHGHLNPQEVFGWLSHLKNADFLRAVRDHCNERLQQLGLPLERPPVQKTEAGTKPISEAFKSQTPPVSPVTPPSPPTVKAEPSTATASESTESRKEVVTEAATGPATEPEVVEDVVEEAAGEESPDGGHEAEDE